MGRTRNLTPDEHADLERALAKLDDEDLGEWDRDFIDDMSRRVMRYGRAVVITGKQWEQIQRIRERHVV